MSALNGWQPIETAPRDGTRVLLFVRGWQCVAWWSGELDDWYVTNKAVVKKPTHWQPLPPPPVSP